MMRKLFICAVAGALTAGNGLAAPVPDLPPLPLRDQGMKPLLRVREHRFKDYTSAGFPHTIPCRISYVDRYFGYLKDSEYNLQEKMPLQSACYSSENPDILAGVPVRLDKETDQWVRDTKEILDHEPSFQEPEARARLDRAYRTYPVTSANAKGFAFTRGDINGEPRARERYFSYCLFKPPKALCGHGQVGQLADPKTDLTAYALQIIRSIEFLDDVPTAAASASASASAAESDTNSIPH